jgi:uncharacterized membrane protein YccC
MPTLFALTLKGFGNLQMALFAGFGSFATLVLVTFAGTRTDKLRAHLGLALAGSVLLTIGTAVNATTAVAAIVTVPVTFAVLFAGVLAPNVATGATGALLVYVLPAASPGTMSMVPDRLAGWWLASVVGTVAVLALPTPATGDRVRAAAARLARALADELDAVLGGQATEASGRSTLEAKRGLLAAFGSTPFRPTGLALRDQALAGAVELLEWCAALVADTVHERSDLSQIAAVHANLIAATAGVLRASGALFAGGKLSPDLDQLDAQRRASLRQTHEATPGTEGFEAEARASFHAHAMAMAALAIGAEALLAAEVVDPAWVETARERWFDGLQASQGRPLLSRYAGAAARHASVRSVWFINSLRGSLALAAAVLVADLTGVQHGFWVVLGTLSVLRTNAAATGATAMRALAGTAAGFAVGGALLVVIGTNTTALWVILPIAVLVAAYAPGTAPFAVGQAAFTVTVAVLFNLLVPVGWKVGELRVEDVALGCAVSVLVGMLVWPRGVASLVGDDLADAYRAGAAYLREAVQWVTGTRTQAPSSGRDAMAAGVRLDDALRGFLSEQGTKHIAQEELWRLIGGTLRLRLTAHAIAGLPRDCAQTTPDSVAAVGDHADALVRFYEQLAIRVGRPRAQASAAGGGLGPIGPPGLDGETAASADGSRQAIWLREHLDHLADNMSVLVEPAGHLAEIRARPWWR